MMIDIDSLSRRLSTLTMQYIQVVTLPSNSDSEARPDAYSTGFKNSKQATKIPVSPNSACVPLSILTAKVLQSITTDGTVTTGILRSESTITLSYVPIMLHSCLPYHHNSDHFDNPPSAPRKKLWR